MTPGEDDVGKRPSPAACVGEWTGRGKTISIIERDGEIALEMPDAPAIRVVPELNFGGDEWPMRWTALKSLKDPPLYIMELAAPRSKLLVRRPRGDGVIEFSRTEAPDGNSRPGSRSRSRSPTRSALPGASAAGGAASLSAHVVHETASSAHETALALNGSLALNGVTPRQKPGDWSCPKCGDHNFRRNLSCRVCRAAKPRPNKAAPPKDFEGMVRHIKSSQRESQSFKERWWDFCDRRGKGFYDPRRHEEKLLAEFLENDLGHRRRAERPSRDSRSRSSPRRDHSRSRRSRRGSRRSRRRRGAQRRHKGRRRRRSRGRKEGAPRHRNKRSPRRRSLSSRGSSASSGSEGGSSDAAGSEAASGAASESPATGGTDASGGDVSEPSHGDESLSGDSALATAEADVAKAKKLVGKSKKFVEAVASASRAERDLQVAASRSAAEEDLADKLREADAQLQETKVERMREAEARLDKSIAQRLEEVRQKMQAVLEARVAEVLAAAEQGVEAKEGEALAKAKRAEARLHETEARLAELRKDLAGTPPGNQRQRAENTAKKSVSASGGGGGQTRGTLSADQSSQWSSKSESASDSGD